MGVIKQHSIKPFDNKIMIKMKYTVTALLAIICASAFTQNQKKEPFAWGVASASYQVEGAYQADGKGLSNWDVYTNEYHITEAFTGKNQTGNVSVNQYDRTQYLKDFALMKALGVSHYRFSLSWARILPSGTGTVNQAGLDHYNKFIDDMLTYGIKPCITLYHWDMPNALQIQGGWGNPRSVAWFTNYAQLVFNSFGKKVDCYITFNEPNIDLFFFDIAIQNIRNKKAPFASTQQYLNQVMASHHLNVASACVISMYHALNLGGHIGITLNLIPTLAKNPKNTKDVATATLFDGLHNRWFLDPALKGAYPTDVQAYFTKNKVNIPSFAITTKELRNWKPDFIGVNYYGVSLVEYDNKFANNANWMTTNPDPDSVKMYNGYVRPDMFYKLLIRLKNEYNNPVIIITENGAGYGNKDEELINGKVNDKLRTNYIKTHIAAALKAKQDGVRLQGYYLWSIVDNFEWLSGYERRFGITYVNFETQERIPKMSYYEYQKIIANDKKK